MKKPVRLIALDLDGTLLQNHGTISEEGLKVLRRAHEKGILIIIASGRPYYSVRRIFSESLFDYAACGNGQEIYDAEGNKLYALPDLDADEIRYLTGKIRHYPVIMSYSVDGVFCHTCSSFFRLFALFYQLAQAVWHIIRGIPVYRRRIIPLSRVHLSSCGKLCFSSSASVLKKFVSGIDCSRFAVFFVSEHWLEIQHAGISKGNALKWIAQHAGIEMEETAAIGDGENDVSMLKEAGRGIAMGNAMPSVQKAADEIALPNAQDGAVVWMEKNLF